MIQRHTIRIWLLTDGRTNVPLQENGDPGKEAVRVAEAIGEKHIPAVVIDTEIGYVKMGVSYKLAAAMGGCYAIGRLSQERLLHIVRCTGKR